MAPNQQETARYDQRTQRRSIRRGKERGVWVFVPAVELRTAGIDPAGDAPAYRLWGQDRGSVLIRFYGRGKS